MQTTKLNFFTRVEWGAEDPTDLANIEAFPADTVLLLYTNTDPCYDSKTCLKTVKALQTKNMQQGMPDIQWNFLVGGDGSVYEGRGWWRAATKDPEYDQYYALSIDIAFIGRPGGRHITEEMTKKSLELVDFGVENKYLTEDRRIMRHPDMANDSCLCEHDMSEKEMWEFYKADFEKILKWDPKKGHPFPTHLSGHWN